MFIDLTATTTPDQAIQMAYDFAGALRATGWPTQDLAYARSLWIGSEYQASTLLPYLDAGFKAGYLGLRKPMAKDVPANDLVELVTAIQEGERLSAIAG